MTEYIRSQYSILRERIAEPRKFMQVLPGPMQVGKSTLVGQVLRDVDLPCSLEVKSGRRKMNSGLPKFTEAFHPTCSFVVGTGGIPLETFLSCNIEDLLH